MKAQNRARIFKISFDLEIQNYFHHLGEVVNWYTDVWSIFLYLRPTKFCSTDIQKYKDEPLRAVFYNASESADRN